MPGASDFLKSLAVALPNYREKGRVSLGKSIEGVLNKSGGFGSDFCLTGDLSLADQGPNSGGAALDIHVQCPQVRGRPPVGVRDLSAVGLCGCCTPPCGLLCASTSGDGCNSIASGGSSGDCDGVPNGRSSGVHVFGWPARAGVTSCKHSLLVSPVWSRYCSTVVFARRKSKTCTGGCALSFFFAVWRLSLVGGPARAGFNQQPRQEAQLNCFFHHFRDFN